jgi:hypothetical protein
MSSPNSWAWNHFYTDKKRHGQNQSANNAWCKACLNAEIGRLREADVLAVAAGLGVTRSEEELHVYGKLICLLGSQSILTD